MAPLKGRIAGSRAHPNARINKLREVTTFGTVVVIDSVIITADSSPLTRRAVEGAGGVREVVERATGAVSLRAEVGGLRVSLRADGTLKVTGSLTKFAAETNIINLTRRGVEEAVRRLAAVLQFDAEAARVYRLDVGATLEMPRTPGVYLARIIGADRYRRKEWSGETVLLQVGWTRKARRCLLLYDKSKESGITERYLLRYEVQFQRKVKEQIGLKLHLADLYAPDVFSQLVRRWQQEFQGVHLSRRHGLQPTGSVRELEQQFAMIGLANTGVQSARNQLAVWREEGAVTDKQYHRLKRRIRELATGGAAEEDQEIINELDRAVRRTADRARSTQVRIFS